MKPNFPQILLRIFSIRNPREKAQWAFGTAIRNLNKRRGMSLLEVMVALGILTAGILSIMAIFPYTIKAQQEGELLSEAAALAQMKAEEIRRDDSPTGTLITEIQALTAPSTPIAFPSEPRLSYSFSGTSLQYSDVTDPTDARAAGGVARVIIRYAPTFRSTQDVIYELRFQ